MQRANAFAPSHSRIFKEMVMLATPAKPFTYTAKGTARRQAIIADYEAEIAELYERYGKDVAASDVSISPLTSCHEEDVLRFVESVIRAALGRDIPDTVDVFQSGCDR